MQLSIKILRAEIIIIAIGMTVLGFMQFTPFLPYNWHVFLHVLGAVLFLGNIIVTALWMVGAEQSRMDSVLRFAARVVNWADVAFTAPGILLLITNGFILAYSAFNGLVASWIVAALVLFSLSGLVWAVFLIPLQQSLAAIAESTSEVLPAPFFAALHRWYVWGVIATLLPVLSLVLMAVKPALW